MKELRMATLHSGKPVILHFGKYGGVYYFTKTGKKIYVQRIGTNRDGKPIVSKSNQSNSHHSDKYLFDLWN